MKELFKDLGIEIKSEFFEGYAVNDKTHLFENKLTRLYKKDWKTILKKGDAVIGIHIPAALPLNDEVCVHSFDVARKVLKSAYPEYDFKAFETSTWLLAPELTYLLKPQSNILKFQKYFTIYPYSNSYASAVRLEPLLVLAGQFLLKLCQSP